MKKDITQILKSIKIDDHIKWSGKMYTFKGYGDNSEKNGCGIIIKIKDIEEYEEKEVEIISKKETLEYALKAIETFNYVPKHYHEGSMYKCFINAERWAESVNWDEIPKSIVNKYEKALKAAEKHYDNFY